LTPVTYFQQSVGAYNTYDMGGNVAEWTETQEEQGTIPLKYIARGGSWRSSYYSGDWYRIALSKWVRPAYRSEQGYDNIGFRVATSLNVASAPPATKAPGEGKLSPKETLEAPFVAVVGLAVILGGKKMYDGHNGAEVQQRGQQESSREKENTEDAAYEEGFDERNIQVVNHNGSSPSSLNNQLESLDTRHNTPTLGQTMKQKLIEVTPITPVKSNHTEMYQVAEWWSVKQSNQQTWQYERPEPCKIIYEKIVNESRPSFLNDQSDFLDTRYHTPLSDQIIDFRDKQRFVSQTDPREKSKDWWTIHDASRTHWQQRAVGERLKEQSVTKEDIEGDISLDHIGAYYPDETSDDSFIKKNILELFGDHQSYNEKKQQAALIKSSPENLSYSGYKSQGEAVTENNNPLAGSRRDVKLLFSDVQH
jgi:hypothetical protein